MSAVTATDKFSPELVTEIFNKTKGHSALAKLSGQTPIPFVGTSEFVFSIDDEASIVGEGGAKPAGSASLEPVVIKPIKVVYQSRITDEFKKASDGKRVEYLRAFVDGYAKKIARALDIIGFHGIDPKSKQSAPSVATKCFDYLVKNKVAYDATKPDDNLDDAAGLLQDGTVTGIALAPAFASAMGKMKANGAYLYPEYRLGRNPETFDGLASDVNNTVSFNDSDDKAIIGDFANAFKWGFAEDIGFEIIEFGDPDGAGRDLKRYNEILLRSEAYIGFGILDADAFAMVTDGTVSA